MRARAMLSAMLSALLSALAEAGLNGQLPFGMTNPYMQEAFSTTQGRRRNRGAVARDKRAATKRANIRKHGGR